LKQVLGFVWMLSPGFVVVVSFWAYSNIYKNTVTIPMAFTAISLFGNLSGPLSSIPTVVIYILQAVVSAKRISNFLAEPEVEDRACALKRQPDAKTPSDSKLVSIQGVYKWFKRSVGTEEEKAPSRRFFGIFKGKKAAAADETDELKGSDDANLAMAQFELHIEDEVIFPEGLTLLGGPTGAGKSSLLAALLGEMDLISGEVSLDKNLANVAYMASVPFLEGATIKNNILFSEPYDETRYNATLEACALRPDLELWDLGDETKIGERGISLSGGQKARIGLAKVVYARSRVVLLDDGARCSVFLATPADTVLVLAAVDTHTARHLVKYCFNGHLMEGRVVILATHHLDICQSSAKLILHMDEGRIASREILTPAQEVHQVPSLPYTAPKPSEDKPVASLDEEEEVIQGAVKLRVFGRYLKAIGLKIWTILMLVQVCSRLLSFGEDWLLVRLLVRSLARLRIPENMGRKQSSPLYGSPLPHCHRIFVPHDLPRILSDSTALFQLADPRRRRRAMVAVVFVFLWVCKYSPS
jgi:ABC-type multidrug transport system ATPase subunit